MTKELTTANDMLPAICTEDSLVSIRLNPAVYPHFQSVAPIRQLGGIQAIMLNCYKLRHQTDISYIRTDSVVLTKKIMANFNYRNLTLEEIRSALENGATGDYGECKGFTVEFCLKCLDRFISDNEAAYLEAKRKREMLEKKSEEQKTMDNIIAKINASKARAERERREAEQREAESRRTILQQFTNDLLKNRENE